MKNTCLTQIVKTEEFIIECEGAIVTIDSHIINSCALFRYFGVTLSKDGRNDEISIVKW